MRGGASEPRSCITRLGREGRHHARLRSRANGERQGRGAMGRRGHVRALGPSVAKWSRIQSPCFRESRRGEPGAFCSPAPVFITAVGIVPTTQVWSSPAVTLTGHNADVLRRSGRRWEGGYETFGRAALPGPASGRTTSTRNPPPRLSRLTVPPSSSTVDLTIERPRPVPGTSVPGRRTR